jgi:large subunit ribosomal protein L22
LVIDLIRGKRAEEALNILQFTRKRVAPDIQKVLRSAIANATESAERVDVDQLWVTRAYVNDGPRLKRIRPAPQGRAYRYQRRLSHVAIHVGDRTQPESFVQRVGEPAAAAPAAPPPPAPARRPPARKPAARRAPAKKAKPSAAKKSGAKKTEKKTTGKGTKKK